MSNTLNNEEAAAENTKQEEQSAWDHARCIATIESYQHYIATHQGGPHVPQALERIDKLRDKAASLARMKDHIIMELRGEMKEVDIKSGEYRGKVLNTDEYHAMQKIDRNVYIVHGLSTLNRVPSSKDPDACIYIRYENGRGGVADDGMPGAGDKEKGGRGG